MKLKTDIEIKALARESAGEPLPDEDLIAHWKCYVGGYEKGYTQAQQDLLASASEGFEDYLKNFTRDGNYQVNRLDLHEQTWQAAALANEKKHQEELKHKQSVIDNLESIRESQLARIEELEKTVASQEKERQRSEAFWKDQLISIQEEGLMKLKEAKEDIKTLIEKGDISLEEVEDIELRNNIKWGSRDETLEFILEGDTEPDEYENVGGKLARSCQVIDQELEKRLEEV